MYSFEFYDRLMHFFHRHTLWACPRVVDFDGPNGVPFYITGPDDDSFRIVAKLEQGLGKGRFEVLDLGKKYHS